MEEKTSNITMQEDKMKIEPGTIVRTVVLAVALINQILVMCGISPLPFDDEAVTEIVSTLVTAGAALAAWWKNNSFSRAAIEADAYMAERKKAA